MQSSEELAREFGGGKLNLNFNSIPPLTHFNFDFGGSGALASSYLSPTRQSNPFTPPPDLFKEWSFNSSLLDPALELADGALSGTSSELDDELRSLQLPYSPRPRVERKKIVYHCKFGEFGVMRGQFSQPSGVAVSAFGDIVVAEANNHRVQVFNRNGGFKFQFGESDRRLGHLFCPNRVAVNRTTGDFVTTERTPVQQIRIFNQYGQAQRKSGANFLQHPRAICIDLYGQIVVVECKVMRVIIFDRHGNVRRMFDCSSHLQFPNSVCTNNRMEIFISDNRAHCIKVFSYSGQYLRQIGGPGITHYPIGVGINKEGQVLIADNHNNFNLTVFTQEGVLLKAMESRFKHAQCFDVALSDDGVVLASKDHRIYVYRC